MRCGECGTVDTPTLVRTGRAWLAVVLWFSAGLFWIVRIVSSLLYGLFVITLGAALVYTLYYLRARERVCRKCGARTLVAENP